MNPLSGIDLASAMPFALLVLFGIVCLLLEVFQRPSQSRQYISRVAAAGFGVTALTAFSLMGLPGTTVFAGSAAFDGFSQVMTMVFCLGGAMASLTAPRYLDEQGIDRGEFYALLLLAVSGMVMMVSAVDLMVLFVGLEIQSIAVYGLTGYLRRSPASAEAGLKYFLLGATASAMMLYGIALLYGATGSTNLVAIGEALGGGSDAGASSASQAVMNGIVGMAQGIDPANNAYWNHANGSLPIAAAKTAKASG
jgi:NADH-quinone oxidoreductase subunit N